MENEGGAQLSPEFLQRSIECKQKAQGIIEKYAKHDARGHWASLYIPIKPKGSLKYGLDVIRVKYDYPFKEYKLDILKMRKNGKIESFDHVIYTLCQDGSVKFETNKATQTYNKGKKDYDILEDNMETVFLQNIKDLDFLFNRLALYEKVFQARIRE